MDALIMLRALLVFIFANNGPESVMPIAYAGIALWCTAAFAYSSLIKRPQPPLFFAVPPRRARWAWADPFPRTWWYACLGTLALLIIVINSAGAQTTTPDLKSIDAVIDAYLPKLQAFEINYLDAKGRGYMQALWSHSAPPADGALVAPDLLTSKPTDQAESFLDLWAAVIIDQGKVPMRFRIDVYDGPDGKGYVLTVESSVGGRTYTRSINTGGEKWREQDWIEVKPDVEVGK